MENFKENEIICGKLSRKRVGKTRGKGITKSE
jgi:hypothetical protein